MDQNYIPPENVTTFVERWRASGGAEQANGQTFINELCDLIGVAPPNPTEEVEAHNNYVFEKSIRFTKPDGSSTTKKADCYKHQHFILENKQGSDPEEESYLSEEMQQRQRRRGTARRGTPGWKNAMEAARKQARRYAMAIKQDQRPPFLLVCDIGHQINVYADFSLEGEYIPWPDQNSYSITLDSLHNHDIIDRLRAIWDDPWSLDESRRRAAVSREIAGKLARLARTFEGQGHQPGEVADFLMRLIFTMFAEDVGLLRENTFTELLDRMRSLPEHFKPQMEDLWQKMATGGFSAALNAHVRHFNGGLFETTDAFAINEDQLHLLIEAGEADWRDVEPAIFGTLLERALDPRERHKLGAHFTPRAYVERLVRPTVIEPLRQQWEAVRDAATQLHELENDKEALKLLRGFHEELCDIKVLDPACGSGNFLYVTLELMKRLEGEVLEMIEAYGHGQMSTAITVDPHQFLGLEINPRACPIADLVLWIGYFQWHFRTKSDPQFEEPIIQRFSNIIEQDAVLAWDERLPRLDDAGEPETIWDGITMKPHPTTGELVPDENARRQVFDYTNPRPATWPAADYVVGNPPFIGNYRMREALGDGYTEAIREAYSELPASIDYVMYWWDMAADLLRAGEIKRFGFITTNSIRQTFNRRVLQKHMDARPPLSLVFAIPDHPWVNSTDGAAVRIAMTVAEHGNSQGILQTVISEKTIGDIERQVHLKALHGEIFSNLTHGVNTTNAKALLSNHDLACPGVKLHGSGFIVERDEAAALGYGEDQRLNDVIREYKNGRDISRKDRDVLVIDLFGLTAEEVLERYPAVYQHVRDYVKPARDTNNNKKIREEWWLHGRPRPELRNYLKGLSRYIATVETSKHRFFVFLDAEILPDNMLVNIALEDAYHLGVLSSNIHVTWALAAGGRLGVGNDPRYNKTICFDTFPFPEATEKQKERIRKLGERLDAHRKQRQAEHEKLTLTGIYNVLEKLRAGEELTIKEREIYEQGLVGVLREIHDELDAAVAEAYGWPAELDETEILRRLVALNQQRAAEEKQGLVRWLRPEYQAPDAPSAPTQDDLGGLEIMPEVTSKAPVPWPGSLVQQVQAVRSALAHADGPLDVEGVASHFKGARRAKVGEILELLTLQNTIEQTEDLRYMA